MRFSTTLKLFLAVSLLGSVIWILELRSDSVDQKKKLTYSLFGTEADAINEFTLEQGDFYVTCAKVDNVWQIRSPLSSRADEGEVDRILNLFESVPRDEIITPAQRMARDLTLKDYGLLDHRARIILSTSLGEKDLLLGYDAPLGDLMYVMYAGGEDVIAVHRSLLGIFPEKVETLRDRQLLHGEAGMTSRLEIHRPGIFIQLARDDSGWIIRQPIAARADAGKVSRLLDQLYALRASSFVWDPVVKHDRGLNAEVNVPVDNTVGDATYNLKEGDASVTISVWVNGDEVGKQVILGAALEEQEDKVYAKLRDRESIYSVEKSILDAFAVSLDDLRDMALYSSKPEDISGIIFEKGDRKLAMAKQGDNSWMITEPVQWLADSTVVMQTLSQLMLLRSESFVDASVTNLAEFGLQPPVYTVALIRKMSEESTDSSEAEEKAVKLMVGKPLNNGKFYYASFEGSGEVMTVPGGVFSGLGPDPADPLIYRERTMLSVSPAEVSSISLSRKGREQAVEMDESGKWNVARLPNTNDTSNLEFNIIPGVIEDVLLSASSIRAARVEKHNPDDMSKYGLDKPSETLTIGLSGGEGIRKSLMLGTEAPAGGRYAIVQGQDVVFVLADNLARKLTRDMIKASIKPETNEEAQ